MSNSFWENKYKDGFVQYYPWDTIVSFVFNNAPKNKPRNEVNILEVGCGTASNLWFAAREGFNVTGIDVSQSAIEFAKNKFKEDDLKGNFSVNEFNALPFEKESFDLVIDRAALTCVGRAVANEAINEIYRVLNMNGRFFFNPYSDLHSSFPSGYLDNSGLTQNITQGTLVGNGPICFYSREQVILNIEKFKLKNLQHMQYEELLNKDKSVHAEWRVIAEKCI
jgi:ubiquinone/menaquinone biosynthesis C-methylase UbiE